MKVFDLMDIFIDRNTAQSDGLPDILACPKGVVADDRPV